MIRGADQPCTRRVIGVTTCPQVGSIFHEGIWNVQKKTWEGSAIPRTMEGDEANYTAFLLGTPSLQAAGCSMQRILKLSRAWVVLCIFHLTTATGRLLGEFVDREARLVTPALHQDLQVLLSERRARWSVYGSASPDGEKQNYGPPSTDRGVQVTHLKSPPPGGYPPLFFVLAALAASRLERDRVF